MNGICRDPRKSLVDWIWSSFKNFEQKDPFRTSCVKGPLLLESRSQTENCSNNAYTMRKTSRSNILLVFYLSSTLYVYIKYQCNKIIVYCWYLHWPMIFYEVFRSKRFNKMFSVVICSIYNIRLKDWVPPVLKTELCLGQESKKKMGLIKRPSLLYT